MNNYLADIGVNLREQFGCVSSEHDYKKVYNLDGSEEDIVFNREDISYVVNSSDIHKSSGMMFSP